MNRRTFLGAAAALATGLVTRPTLAQDSEPGPWRTISRFEQVRFPDGTERVRIAPMADKSLVAGDGTIYEVHAFTVYRHQYTGEPTEVNLFVKYGEGETREAAVGAMLERIAGEAHWLVKQFAPVGRKLVLLAGQPTVFWSSARGVWKARQRAAVVIVPEFALYVE